MRRRVTIRRRTWLLAGLLLLALSPARGALAQAWGLPEMSGETKACIECHKIENAPIYQQWGASKHYRANVGCYECHAAAEGEPDAFQHEGQWIATIVSPKDCARCHAREAAEFGQSHHSKGARILGSLDNVLAEVVEGNSGLITPAFQQGTSAAAVSGCGATAAGSVLSGGKSTRRPGRTPASGGSIPTSRRAPARPAIAGIRSRPTRPGIPTTAASATWGPTTRRWKSTTNRSTGSRSGRSATSSTWIRPSGSWGKTTTWRRPAPPAT